jgi:hypothetical protein
MVAPDRAQPRKADVVLTERSIPHTSRRNSAGEAQGATFRAHFPIHLGLHYSGRDRRYQKRGSTAVRLKNKRWILSQGRSWTRAGAEHLIQLLWLQTHPADWTHWWSKPL